MVVAISQEKYWGSAFRTMPVIAPIITVSMAPRGVALRLTMPSTRGMPMGMANIPVNSLLASKAPPKSSMNKAPSMTSNPTRTEATLATSNNCLSVAFLLINR